MREKKNKKTFELNDKNIEMLNELRAYYNTTFNLTFSRMIEHCYLTMKKQIAVSETSTHREQVEQLFFLFTSQSEKLKSISLKIEEIEKINKDKFDRCGRRINEIKNGLEEVREEQEKSIFKKMRGA